MGWICPHCDMNGYSNYECAYPKCHQCGTEFNWTRVGYRDAVARAEKELGWKWEPYSIVSEESIEKGFRKVVER